ncbi:peptidase A2 domain-containing protein [Trichonephila clavipes]|nr:peptidase A2 domain-containing protein [Trichonephila clavipes]
MATGSYLTPTYSRSQIDTGSQVTLMKESVWNQLGSPTLINSSNILTGFGLSKTHVIGSFNSTVSIDNQKFPVKINVVPNHSMTFDIIIGCNLIKQANLTITPDSVMFSKPQIEVSDASPQPFVFAITDDIPKFDIGPLKFQNKLVMMLRHYSYVIGRIKLKRRILS